MGTEGKKEMKKSLFPRSKGRLFTVALNVMGFREGYFTRGPNGQIFARAAYIKMPALIEISTNRKYA